MCRVPRVLVVAPSDLHADLRRKLSSLDYDITATVAGIDEATAITADIAVVWEPGDGDVAALQELGIKVAAFGGATGGAELSLDPADVAAFKARVWDLLRSG